MLPIMYELPSRDDVERVIITRQSVLKEAAPTYVFKPGVLPEGRTA